MKGRGGPTHLRTLVSQSPNHSAYSDYGTPQFPSLGAVHEPVGLLRSGL